MTSSGDIGNAANREPTIHLSVPNHLQSRRVRQPKRNRCAIRPHECKQFTRRLKLDDEVISTHARGGETPWRSLRSERLPKHAARHWNAASSAERAFCRGRYFRRSSRAIRSRCIRASKGAFVHDREQLRMQPTNGVFLCPSQRWDHLGARS